MNYPPLAQGVFPLCPASPAEIKRGYGGFYRAGMMSERSPAGMNSRIAPFANSRRGSAKSNLRLGSAKQTLTSGL
ncbi:MAG: hypothetical protein XD82_0652 [Methanoculleus marisnigri]|uniref:Uncharacterized protein n=1 Tax=Methanoculleus marisnigri TaxID=2198 RepID=A0A101GPZ5_9EURY|nr:MAG: hypothetical protein XD82_0652 [Methanoculleus marisnigri]